MTATIPTRQSLSGPRKTFKHLRFSLRLLRTVVVIQLAMMIYMVHRERAVNTSVETATEEIDRRVAEIRSAMDELRAADKALKASDAVLKSVCGGRQQ